MSDYWTDNTFSEKMARRQQGTDWLLQDIIPQFAKGLPEPLQGLEHAPLACLVRLLADLACEGFPVSDVQILTAYVDQMAQVKLQQMAQANQTGTETPIDQENTV